MPENCGSLVIFTSLALIFFIGINYMKPVVAETVVVLTIVLLLPLALIAFLAKVYWLFYFWTQFTIARKFGEIFKITFYTFLLSVAAFPAIKILYISGLKWVKSH